jgi:predicted transcriptional regulator
MVIVAAFVSKYSGPMSEVPNLLEAVTPAFCGSVEPGNAGQPTAGDS